MQIPLADLPQRPIDGFLQKISIVVRFAFEEQQEARDLHIVGFFIVHREPAMRRGPRVLRIPLAFRPGKGFVISNSRLAEKMSASAVANRPVIEVPHPGFPFVAW